MSKSNGKLKDAKPSEASEKIRKARADLLLALQPDIERLHRNELSAEEVFHLMKCVLAANMLDPRASSSTQAVGGLLKVIENSSNHLAQLQKSREDQERIFIEATGGARSRAS